MAWHSVALLLGLLLIWTTTTGGQVTEGSGSTTQTYTTFPTPGATPSSSAPPSASTAGFTASSTALGTTGSSSTTQTYTTFPTPGTTPNSSAPPSSISTAGFTTSSTDLGTGFSSIAPPSESTSATTAGTTLSSPALTTDVPLCDPACADNELCTNSAGHAECKCQRSKYLNASSSDIAPSVQCEGSAMTLSLNKCLLERFNYSFKQMHFVDSNCTATTSLQLVGNERVIQIKAIPQAGWCGNDMVIYDKTVTYSNVLYIPPDDSSGIIIGSSLRFIFSCTYNMTMQTSLLTTLHPITEPVTLPSEDGSGSITATMATFKSNSFTDPLTENEPLTVGTPVYIGISTTFPDGDTFTLRAERCVASPSINSADPSVELISGGCAMTQDMNVQVVENGQSLQVMFEIETFIFNGQPDVYMRCNVSLCLKDPSNTCQCSSSSGSANLVPTLKPTT